MSCWPRGEAGKGDALTPSVNISQDYHEEILTILPQEPQTVHRELTFASEQPIWTEVSSELWKAWSQSAEEPSGTPTVIRTQAGERLRVHVQVVLVPSQPL